MNPPAEDGGGPPAALVQDHASQNHASQNHASQDHASQDHAQDREEQPGAVSVPPRRAPIDGFAVASLISGILALVPLAVIFGPVALSRMARTGARGRALAITGLALGGTWAIAAAIAVAVIITQRPPARLVTVPKVFGLRTGECINSAPNGTSGVHVLACGQPHDGEVFATFRLAGQHYPGAAAVRQKTNEGCGSRLSGYMNPQLSTMLNESYAYPSPGAWAAGERTVVCTVRGTNGKLIGSVRTMP